MGGKLRPPRDTGHGVLNALLGPDIAGDIASKQLQIAADDLEQIVEVVSYAAGQLADRLHLLDMSQLGFEGLPFRDGFRHPGLQGRIKVLEGFPGDDVARDIARFDHRADCHAVLVSQRTGGETHGVETAVLVYEGRLALNLIVLREGAIDFAFVQGKGPAVRVSMMDDVVKRLPRDFF